MALDLEFLERPSYMKDMATRPFTHSLERLRAAGLRPTRQRLALVRFLFEGGDRHVTAEQLHAEALASGVSISLATIYNSLHQFTSRSEERRVGKECRL